MPARIRPLEAPFDDRVADTLAAMMPPGMPPIALFRTVAHNPRVLQRFQNGSLLDRGSIARRDREIVILRTTARCGSEYEWGVHVAFFAERVGLAPETVAATRTGEPSDPAFSERDRVLVRTVDALHERSTVDEAVWEDLRSSFTDEQIVEILVLAGFYHMVSFVTNAVAIENEPGAPRFPDA